VQERPRREVALKVLRPGVGSADAIRRFEREAEFLARLRHPGIATVYDAGVTTVSSGGVAERIPYIAMEYIRGERLDRHAGSRGLDVEQRLELVAKIADAVNHAHVHGLVHRDLKPGNILVVPPDGGGEGEPKVLDFGIARITGDDGAGTLQTSTGQLLGTIPYMSPEQLAGDPEAVDARSDVYSLGVIAYELLTGRLPHDVRRLSIAEAARVIRDVSPDPPGRLRPALRGDIETIVLKMLEKEPRRRYRTAVEAAEDIRRFLARKPVRARPAGPLYQLSRFAQRNRALATTFAGLVGVLVAAAVLSGALALRARRAERAAQRQLEEARRQAEKFEAVNLFLEEMMAAASPEDNPGGADVTVRESLGKGASRLDEGSLASQPAIELGVRTTIGNTYRALGENEAAREQLERAVVLGRALYPDGHEDLAFALNKLGRVLQALAAYDAAEEVFRESLTMRRALDAGSREVATSLNNLADVVSRRGRNEEALALHEEALALRRALLGPAHEEIANSLNNIAALHYSTGNVESAEAMFRESLEMDRALRGDLHPNVAATMSNLATVLSFLERYEEAEPLHRRALELEREIYGADHPRVARALRNLARFLVDTGRQEEAEPLLVEALDLTRRGHGMEHPAVAGALTDLAVLHEKRGDLERAESMYGEALAIRRATLGEDAVPTLGSRYSLARIAVERGHLDRAAAAYASVAEDARRLLPADSRYLFAILTGYGLCLAELERREDAVRVLEEARAVGLDSVGENAPRLAEVTATLARLRGAP
jgi:tetratricopeptide (TPR) repeat protein